MKKISLLFVFILLFTVTGCDMAAFEDYVGKDEIIQEMVTPNEEPHIEEDIFVEAEEEVNVEGVDYYIISDDPYECDVLRFECDEGFEPFFNEVECGCRLDDGLPNKIRFETRSIEEETIEYIIEVEYPEFEDYPKVNELFKEKVESSIEVLIAEIEELELTEDTIEEFEFGKNSLYSGFVIFQANEDYISLYFMNSVYWAGAAHPNSYTDVFNYDLVNDKEILLMDFFVPDTNYWGALSAVTIPKLNEMLYEDEFATDEWIEDGAGPEPENFEAFTFDRFGLVIHFDPYVVAPYAAGPQRVEIPFDELYAILMPQWTD